MWVFELGIALERSLKLLDLDILATAGLNTARYGQLSYNEQETEYPRSQDIGEAAHFLDFDGLVVPSARYDCLNVVVFCDKVLPEAISITADHRPVDWATAG